MDSQGSGGQRGRYYGTPRSQQAEVVDSCGVWIGCGAGISLDSMRKRPRIGGTKKKHTFHCIVFVSVVDLYLYRYFYCI